MRAGCLALGLIAALAAATPVTAAAQQDASEQLDGEAERRDREARSLFQAGSLAVEDGRYEDALGYFRRAHELSGRPLMLYNIGVVAERMQRDEEALEAFRAYLEAEPEAENRREVERRVELLEESVAERRTAAERDALLTTAEPSEPEPSEPLWTRWWLWTAIGAVVAGGVVAAILVASSDDDVQEPIPGRDGVVVFTLEAP